MDPGKSVQKSDKSEEVDFFELVYPSKKVKTQRRKTRKEEGLIEKKVGRPDDHNDDAFNSCLNPAIFADNAVDKVFERFEDPHAKFFTPKTPKTSRPYLSSYEQLLSSSPTTTKKEWKYITQEEREARRKAALEGQKDIFEVYLRKGIDPKEFVNSLFRSVINRNTPVVTPKATKSSESISTPLPGSSINKFSLNTEGDKISEGISTPIARSSLITTCSPKDKTSSECFSTPLPGSSNNKFSPITERETISGSILTPIAGSSHTTDFTPTTKSSALRGLVCYADVTFDGEDVSSGVYDKLQSLGARIVKRFTKKVTHVIFKDGRDATYLKAKKVGVPLVALKWIEACEKICGLADPSKYPPINLKKYENINKDILPFQTIKKRRLRFYNPTSNIRQMILEFWDDPGFIPTQNGRKLAEYKAKRDSIRKDSKANADQEFVKCERQGPLATSKTPSLTGTINKKSRNRKTPARAEYKAKRGSKRKDSNSNADQEFVKCERQGPLATSKTPSLRGTINKKSCNRKTPARAAYKLLKI